MLVGAGHPGKHKRVVWMVARQHPGEAMAEWFVEGFLNRLTDPHDAAAMRVLEHAVFYVVSLSFPCTSNAYPPLPPNLGDHPLSPNTQETQKAHPLFGDESCGKQLF